MDNETDGKTRMGSFVPVAKTAFSTFEPNELPIRSIRYDDKLIRMISESSLKIGNLSEAGRRMLNPSLLIRPYLKREAVSSSRIEGTKTTLSDVFKEEAVERKRPDDDMNETLNYEKALYEGISRIDSGERISSKMLTDLHAILLSGVRGEDKDPGKFKSDINWIGASHDIMEADFIPCHPSSVRRLIDNLVWYINSCEDDTSIIRSAVSHYQFETIHPFRDGNGRIGRLLVILFLYQEKILSQPLLFISPFFEKHKEEYINRLRRVSMRGDIEAWLSFFLTAVKEQSTASLTKIQNLEDLRRKYEERLKEVSRSSVLIRLLDAIFQNPYLSTKRAVNELKIGYSTISYNIGILERTGIIREVASSPSKLYYAEEVDNILEM